MFINSVPIRQDDDMTFTYQLTVLAEEADDLHRKNNRRWVLTHVALSKLNRITK